jgi:hypothetical protein
LVAGETEQRGAGRERAACDGARARRGEGAGNARIEDRVEKLGCILLGCGLWPLILFGMHYSPWADMLVGLYILATRLYRSGRSRATRANGLGHLRTAGRGSGP